VSSQKYTKRELNSEDEFIANIPDHYRIFSPVKPTLKRHPSQGMCMCESDKVEESPSESLIENKCQNLVEMPDDNVLESFILEYDCK